VAQRDSVSATRLRSLHDKLITASNDLLIESSDKPLDTALRVISNMLEPVDGTGIDFELLNKNLDDLRAALNSIDCTVCANSSFAICT
jgi:hypothetical protein